MVEVFKTNISQAEAAAHVISSLQADMPQARVTVDIEDCDHVLRVQHDHIDTRHILHQVHALGFDIDLLD